jgi:hypothetical protein
MKIKVIGICVILLLSSLFSSENDQQIKKDENEVGRYQVSTVYRETGGWVFVTIIDTKTGEIVKQERYHGFGIYTYTEK